MTDSEIKLNQKQAAKLLDVEPETLSKWRVRNRGPVYLRISGKIRYLKSDVLAYLDSCRIIPSERQHNPRGKRKAKRAPQLAAKPTLRLAAKN
jgi:hypothetical protein